MHYVLFYDEDQTSNDEMKENSVQHEDLKMEVDLSNKNLPQVKVSNNPINI